MSLPRVLWPLRDARLGARVGLDQAHVPDRSRLAGGRGGTHLLLVLPPAVGLLGSVDRKVRQFEQRAELGPL